MTLIRQLRDFFSAYDRLFTDLNRACSCLTEGQAFLVTCDGEFTVRPTAGCWLSQPSGQAQQPWSPCQYCSYQTHLTLYRATHKPAFGLLFCRLPHQHQLSKRTFFY